MTKKLLASAFLLDLLCLAATPLVSGWIHVEADSEVQQTSFVASELNCYEMVLQEDESWLVKDVVADSHCTLL